MKTKYYRLAETVEIQGNIVVLNDVELFETNRDAAKLVHCIKALSLSNWFTVEDVVLSLGLEDTEQNSLSVQNVLDYLRRCFVLNEDQRE